MARTVGIDYEVRKLSGWMLAFAVAEYASGRKVDLARACGEFPFHFVDRVCIPVKGENGQPDSVQCDDVCSCFTNGDFLEIVDGAGLEVREEGLMFVCEVYGFPAFESMDRYEAKARALVARCAKSEVVTVPKFS